MSDSEESEKEVKDEALIAKQVEEKCWEAVLSFDWEGSGQIQSSEFKALINMIGIKMSDDEIFKMISEIDPENNGLIMYSDFK